MASMKIRFLTASSLVIAPAFVLTVLAQTSGTPAASTKAVAPAQATVAVVQTATTEKALLNQYCVTCHNQKAKAAGLAPAQSLTLDDKDSTKVEHDAETWERVIHKVRAGMMPPSGMPRPKPEVFESMIAYLENELDKHSVTNIPSPGLHRLNR